MSYQKNELLKHVEQALDEIKAFAYDYESDIELFRKALRFQPGDHAIVVTNDTCPCCNDRIVRIIKVFLDEFEGPAIEAQFLKEIDPNLLECSSSKTNTCIFAPDHLQKVGPCTCIDGEYCAICTKIPVDKPVNQAMFTTAHDACPVHGQKKK